MNGEFSDWYDEKVAARVLGVSARTLRAWRKAGKIAFHRTPGGRIRYTIEQLLAVQQGGIVPAALPRAA